MSKPNTSEETVINILLGALDDLEIGKPEFTITSETTIKEVCDSGTVFGWFMMDLDDRYQISLEDIDDDVFEAKTIKEVSEYLTQLINKRTS